MTAIKSQTKKPRRKRLQRDYPLEALRLLSRYHYLTIEQMVALDLAGSEKAAWNIVTRNMAGNKPYVGRVKYPPSPVEGKLHDMYYLTKQGAARVIELLNIEPDQVHYPKGKPPKLQDYFHRRATIDFHIELDRLVESHNGEVNFFHTYFDKTGANRNQDPASRLRALSKIPVGEYFLIPDANFFVTSPNNDEYLFTAEIYNGRDTKRVLQQLDKHRYLLDEGSISAHYKLGQTGWRVLSVFETTAAMNAVIKRFAANPDLMRYQDYFAFSTLDKLRVSFAHNWLYADGTKRGIFGGC